MTYGIPTPSMARTERRCPACRAWYEKKLGDCPHCEAPAAQFNPWLKTAALNSQLYDQARTADREKKYAQARGL